MDNQAIQEIYTKISTPGLVEDGYKRIIEEYKDLLISEFSRTRMAYEAKQRSSGEYMDGLCVANLVIPTSSNAARLERSANALRAISEECDIVSSACEKLKGDKIIDRDELLKAFAVLLKPTSVSFK